MDHMTTGRPGARIAVQLHAQMRSGRWLARQVGMPASTMKRVLLGERDLTTAELLAVAAALEVDVADLLPPVTDRTSA